ncbi:MAG: hypothetical protein ACLRI8_05025 [Agathobacter rectalis]
MGYTEESMRSMRYKMSVYDDFTEEYDYRVKYNRNHSSEEQLKAQAEQQIITRFVDVGVADDKALIAFQTHFR